MLYAPVTITVNHAGPSGPSLPGTLLLLFQSRGSAACTSEDGGATGCIIYCTSLESFFASGCTSYRHLPPCRVDTGPSVPRPSLSLSATFTE